MYSLSWLGDVLHLAGLTVIDEPGWQTRGHGDMGEPLGILCHHTAGAAKGDAPSLSVVRDGRPDLKGPLAHLVLSRSGVFHVVAAGMCWHAGAGTWEGVTAGNSHFIGIEAENTGLATDPWPEVQMDAYARGCAAILKKIGRGPIMCAGHKEYATPPGRKVDPSFDMEAFRTRVQTIMEQA